MFEGMGEEQIDIILAGLTLRENLNSICSSAGISIYHLAEIGIALMGEDAWREYVSRSYTSRTSTGCYLTVGSNVYKLFRYKFNMTL